ncbi:O-antigen ligase domain-containing protein [Rhodococcus sp. P1Y]|nr:O-antigen ligase domain-containing protein [Rhodococcus sp. P1Y]
MAGAGMNRVVVPVLTLLVLPLVVGIAFGSGQAPLMLVGILLIGGLGALAVAVSSPQWSFLALAFVLGAAPFAVVPGLPLPIVLVLVILVWMSTLLHPIELGRTDPVELAVYALMGTSLVSVIATAVGVSDITEFIRWVMATSIIFPLLRLPRPDLQRFGRVFVYGVGGGSAFALAMFFLDKSGSWMNYLSAIGYGTVGTIGTHLRFYTDGLTQVVRLTGTYVDPNVAGIFTFVGLALAITLLRGWPRLIFSGLLASALLVTLSRSALFSVVVAALVYLVFQRLRTDARLGILAGGIALGAAALSVPAVADRILNSFGSDDKGTTDRAAALSDFPASMSGHWLFGKGWGIAEFTDEVAGYNANYVANSPLVSIYRGGILVGIAFVLVLAAGFVVAHRNARKPAWESGITGAALVGFSLVALQLDFPVVTHAPVTMAFVVLLVFVAADGLVPEKNGASVTDQKVEHV